MSKIKPVYQSQTGGVWHDVTDKEYAFRRELSGVYQTRILYPAAAYEALQKENAEFKRILEGVPEGAFDGGWTARGIMKHAANLERDNTAQANRIEQQAEDNLKQKDLILNFQTQYAKDHAEIESLRKQVEELTSQNQICRSAMLDFMLANGAEIKGSASKNGE